LNILGVDLVERRITSAGVVVTEHRPVGLSRSG